MADKLNKNIPNTKDSNKYEDANTKNKSISFKFNNLKNILKKPKSTNLSPSMKMSLNQENIIYYHGSPYGNS